MAKTILVETSARHVHVSQADLETLFGKGYQLTNKKDLSQPGQQRKTGRTIQRRIGFEPGGDGGKPEIFKTVV